MNEKSRHQPMSISWNASQGFWALLNFFVVHTLKTNMTLEKSPIFLIGDTSSFMVDFPASRIHILFKFIDLMIDFGSSCRIPLAEKPCKNAVWLRFRFFP